MTWILEKITKWAALAGVILAAGLTIFLKGRSIGTATEKAKQQANEIKAIEKAKDIKNEVDGLKDADVDKQLVDNKWVRDDHGR